MIRCASSSIDDTAHIAAAVADLVVDGDLIALVGGLGAGKTAFTREFAVSLGVDQRVTSPTFTLANRYEGRLVVNHLDVYRLEGAGESRDLGIDELLDDGVTLIEWADVISAALPEERLDISFGFGERDDDRTIDIQPRGTAWNRRAAALADAVQRWAPRDIGVESC